MADRSVSFCDSVGEPIAITTASESRSIKIVFDGGASNGVAGLFGFGIFRDLRRYDSEQIPLPFFFCLRAMQILAKLTEVRFL